jgi:hypothetical protein
MTGMAACFAEVPDPRTGHARRWDFLEPLTMALTARVCGAETCVDFADFAADREPLFRSFLKLENGLPGNETSQRCFGCPLERPSPATGASSSGTRLSPTATTKSLRQAHFCGPGPQWHARHRRCVALPKQDLFGDRGRLEMRRHRVSHDGDRLLSDRPKPTNPPARSGGHRHG